MPIQPQPQPHLDAFEDGRLHALQHRSAADCPIPLSYVAKRAAWLDGYQEGRRQNDTWNIGDGTD
jgi:ribosome modulation factor